ncbi:hypothetical protein ACFLQZ_01310 [Acidobacteriota bacterium]
MRFNQHNQKNRIPILYKVISFSFILFLFLSKNVYAYLDPGTGSYLIQVLLAAVVGIGVAYRFFWGKIKATFKKIFSKKTPA